MEFYRLSTTGADVIRLIFKSAFPVLLLFRSTNEKKYENMSQYFTFERLQKNIRRNSRSLLNTEQNRVKANFAYISQRRFVIQSVKRRNTFIVKCCAQSELTWTSSRRAFFGYTFEGGMGVRVENPCLLFLSTAWHDGIFETRVSLEWLLIRHTLTSCRTISVKRQFIFRALYTRCRGQKCFWPCKGKRRGYILTL